MLLFQFFKSWKRVGLPFCFRTLHIYRYRYKCILCSLWVSLCVYICTLKQSAVYFCSRSDEEEEGSRHLGFVSSTGRQLAGTPVSVSGITPPETGFMPFQLNSLLLSLSSPIHSRNGGLPCFPAPCCGCSTMSYHRTKHKSFFLGSWVEKGWPAKDQTGILLPSTVWLPVQN